MLKNDQLYQFNIELRSLAESVMDNNLTVGRSGFKDTFIAFAFGKVYKTHTSILILCDHGLGQDASMLARSLFELAVTTLYILNDPTEGRVKRYMEFDWVMRKKMYEDLRSIVCLTKDINQKWKDNQTIIEEVFQKGSEAQAKYNYGFNWSDKGIKDMAKEVGLGNLHPTAYRLYCNLHHSESRSMNDYLKIKDGVLEIDSGSSENSIGEALAGAINFFAIILEKWNECFKLDLEEKLKEFVNRYEAESSIKK